MKRIAKLICDERAATAVEYGLILAMIVLAMMGGLVLFADTTIGMWQNVASAVSSA